MDKGKGKQVQLDGFLKDGGKAYLRDLNEAQREAVTFSSVGGLQILAGPGSGMLQTAHVVNIDSSLI